MVFVILWGRISSNCTAKSQHRSVRVMVS